LKKTARPLETTLLRLIWDEGQISRAEIARQAELSRSTVSQIVGTLISAGLVAEVGVGPSSGGRRPIVLQFRDDAYSILGIEMGATHVAVTLTNLRGRVLAWEQHDHPVRTDPRGTRLLIDTLCDACLASVPEDRRQLVGIGVAVPSPVHPTNPDWLSEVVLPEWQGRLGLHDLERKHGVSLLVDNDANLGALAEQWWGAGIGKMNFSYIKIGTGVGSGHVIGGEVYRGSTGVAGEVGHLSIDPKGKPCVCGLRGCLATLVGGGALVERAKELSRDFPASVLSGREATVAEIEDAALAGDPLALQVTREAAGYLATAVAGILNLLNPDMIVLGGGLARVGELLLKPLRDTVKSQTLVSSLAASEIRASTLGPRTVAIGAATFALKSALEDWRKFPAPLSASERP
jgi:glucokinase-like ROK family protein